MKPRGFTLIELLVVIAIIGVLSSIVLASLNSARAKARDASRLATLDQLRIALELYASSNNGLYPSTAGTANWFGVCTDAGSKTTTGAGGWIPNLAPTYISVLPTDPLKGSASCTSSAGNSYLYTSNGTDYMILAYATAETYTTATNPMKRPAFPDGLTFAMYTSGASGW